MRTKYTKTSLRAGLVAAVLALPGCAAIDEALELEPGEGAAAGVMPTLGLSCGERTEKAVATANWRDSKVVDVIYDIDGFEPMVIELTVDKPYLIRVRNRMDDPLTIRTAGMLDAIGFQEIKTSGQVQANPCPYAVEVPALEYTEMKVIGYRHGRFPVEDQLIPILFSSGPKLVVQVVD